MNDMVNMEWDDIEPAQELLLRAFKNYPMHNWIFDTEKNPEPILRALNRACIKYCIRWGKAFKMPNLEVILLVKKPTDKDSFWHNFRAGMLKILFLANKTSVKRMVWINERILEERKKIMGGAKTLASMDYGHLTRKSGSRIWRYCITSYDQDRRNG